MTAANNPVNKPVAGLAGDGRQSETALEIQRGVVRVLLQHGLASLCELPLPNGRRADVVGVSEKGEIWIVEIKSCLADFRSDIKWTEYRDFCDRLLFAVKPGFPLDVLPADAGLMLADRYGGEIVRPAPETPLAPARRKALTLRIARTAANRFQATLDPSLATRLDPGEL